MKPCRKQFLSVLLIAALLIGLCACGGKENSSGSGAGYKEYLFNESQVSGPEAMPQIGKPLDPQALYASVTYTPAMLCGMYSYGNHFEYGISAEEEAARESEFTALVGLTPYKGEYSEYRTVLPIGYRAGYNTLYSVYSTINGRYWMEMTFLNENGNILLVKGAYTVDGKVLSFYPFTQYDYDSETETLHYELAEESMDFTFSFCGPELTLSAEGKTATLKAHGFEDGSVVSMDGYAAPDSPLLGNIDNIFYYATDEKGEEYKNLRLEIKASADSSEYDTVSNAILHLESNGLATIAWSDDLGEHLYQAIYFHAGKDGLVLYDGTNTYYYTDDYSLRTRGRVSTSVSEEVDLELLTDEEVEDLSEKRLSLLTALSDAFAASQLNVRVDLKTGEVMLDSAVLFALNSSEISGEGQAFLKEFITYWMD